MKSRVPVNRLSSLFARGLLRLISWKAEINPPDCEKFVLIGAPHTSNFDFIFMLLLAQVAGIKLHWIGKHTLFRPPLGGIMRWLGGIPVDRSSSNQFVKQIVDAFGRFDKFAIAIAPEGTRGKSDYWKTGFYHIAVGAFVPIAFGYIDYRQRVVGIGPSLYPTGDIYADFPQIKAFYSNKTGRRPELQGEIKIR